MSQIQKLVQLKSFLTSYAYKLIMNVETTESNYEAALPLLEQWYGNNRFIIQKLLSQIQGTRIVSRKRFVAFLLFENSVSESQNAWKAANDGNEALDFNRFMVILEDRVRSLEF